MKIRITRTVPGYTNGRFLVDGDVVTVPDGMAISLMADGYAVKVQPVAVAPVPVPEVEVERATPAERRETATPRRGPGRPRKTGS